MLRAKPKRVFDRNINRKLKLTKYANAVPAYIKGGPMSANREVYYNYHYPPFAYHMKWNGPTVSTLFCTHVRFLDCRCTFSYFVQGSGYRDFGLGLV